MEQHRLKRLGKVLWIISMIVFGISLLCPTYCTNVECSSVGSGLMDFLFGWFGALFLGDTYFAWFANPFFITAIFVNRKSPVWSLILSVIALSIALSFIKGGTVLLNEAGHEGYITKLQLGYWLWISSLILMLVSSIVGTILIVKRK